MDVVLIAFFNYCNIELTVLLYTGIWHPKSKSHMLGNEPHEPWLDPPDRHQPSTRSRSAPDTQGKETRGQQWPPRTKGAPRRAHSSRHAKGNWIMCSATGEICLLTYSALIQIGRKHIPTTDGWTKLPTVVEPEPPSWNQEQSSRKANSTRQAWLISLLLYVTTVSRTNQSPVLHMQWCI